MKTKYVATVFLLALATSQTVFALDTADEIFTRRADGSGAQVVLGIGELLLADHLSKLHLNVESTALSIANQDLDEAKALLTEAERDAKIKAIQENTGNYIRTRGPQDGAFQATQVGELTDEAAEEIQELKSSSLVSAEEKTKAVEAAKQKLDAARENALKGLQSRGKIDSGIRIVRAVGVGLLLIDVAGRVYIYNSLERDPTLSPVATYILNLAD